MLPLLGLPVGNPGPASFDSKKWLEEWLEKFEELKHMENYEAADRAWKDATSGLDIYIEDLLKERKIQDMHWYRSTKDVAVELDKKKQKVMAMFKELERNPTPETLKPIIEVHVSISDDMEMMKKDPSAPLWSLMKEAIKDALRSFPTLYEAYEWDDGSVSGADAGIGREQHGYFKIKIPKNRKKSKRGRV